MKTPTQAAQEAEKKARKEAEKAKQQEAQPAKPEDTLDVSGGAQPATTGPR